MKSNSINVNTSGLRKWTTSHNKKAILDLFKAREQLRGIKMPENFSKAIQLSEIPKRIEKVERDIEGINSYIDSIISKYKVAQNKSKDEVNDYLKVLSASLYRNEFGIAKQNKDIKSWQISATPTRANLSNLSYWYKNKEIDNNLSKKMTYPFSNEYLQKKYDNTKALIMKNNMYSLLDTNYERRKIQITNKKQENIINSINEEKFFHVSDNIDLLEKIQKDLGGDAIQSMTYDGKDIILSIGKKQNGTDSGGIIAKYNPKTGKLKEFIDLWKTIGAERAGHMEGITYNSKDNTIIVKNYKKDESSIFEINNKTKEITEYKVPEYYRDLAYDETNHQLIGFKKDDKTFTFLTRNDVTKEYGNPKNVNLDYNKDFENIQGISCDKQYIYLYQSDHEDKLSQDEWKTYVFDYKGRKVDEYKIGNGFIHWKEVESGFTDKDNNLWICGPFEVAKVKNYKSGPKTTTVASNK